MVSQSLHKESLLISKFFLIKYVLQWDINLTMLDNNFSPSPFLLIIKEQSIVSIANNLRWKNPVIHVTARFFKFVYFPIV